MLTPQPSQCSSCSSEEIKISSTRPTISLPTPPKSPSFQPSFELVIAHYNEDLKWLLPYSSNCTIYSKGNPPPPPFPHTYPLPNIGRETHTYLTHIVRNYHKLPDLVFLLQGNIHDINHGTPAHTTLTVDEILTQASLLPPQGTLPIGNLHTFSDWPALQYLPGWVERRGKALKRTSLSPARFWEDVLFHSPHPPSVRFVQGALFAVTREAITRRPREFYEDVLRYFEELNEVNPEEGHYMERFWWAVLDDEALLGEAVQGNVGDRVNGVARKMEKLGGVNGVMRREVNGVI